jgi:hypothetical protein
VVRLTGTGDPSKGRAEMFRNGQWGTICDIGWNDGGWPTVFCKELGFESADGVYATKKGLSPTDLPVAFESPNCNPTNAASMAVCGQDSNPSCGHDKDVYVECYRG